jgi:tetratricopeptide (TPR) repeat protein
MLQARKITAPAVGLAVMAVVGPALLPAGAQDIPDTSVEAIRAYADGAEHYRAARYREAIPHFARAHAVDPTFFTPVFMQYVIAINLNVSPQVDSLAAVLQRNRHRLSEYYQGMFDAIVLNRQAHFAAAVDALRKVVERYPGTKAAYNYANFAWVKDPQSALQALEQLDPDREPIRGWLSYWTIRGNTLHTLGDLEGALQNALEAQKRHPDQLAPVGWEIDIQAALGNVAEVEKAMVRAQKFPNANPGLGYQSAGQELLAHGHEREGRILLERALTWFNTEDKRTTAAAKAQRAYTLVLLGRHSEGRDVYRQLNDQYSTNYNVALAVTSAQAGDRATAQALLARVQLGEIGGANWRARAGSEALIHAALGDVASASNALTRFGIRPLWVHQDPTFLRVLGADAFFQRFLATGSGGSN